MALPDSFTGTDGTELSAYDALWVKHPTQTGVMAIASNRAARLVSPATTAEYYYNSAPASADYDVTADVVYSNSALGLIGRVHATADSGYLWRYVNATSLQLMSFVSGLFTSLGSIALGSTASALRLSMAGTTIKGFADGVEKISVTNSAVTAIGFGGLRSNSGAVTNTYDNFDVVVAGGATYTLAADTTVVTLGGQDAGLIANRRLAADSSALTLAGQDAALTAHRRLAADSDAMSLAGQDATLTYTAATGATYTLTASSGSLILASQDAALIASRRLAADSAAFALALQDAGLSHGYVLAAASGDYALAGQDATLTASRRMAAESAALTLAGQAAALTYSNEAPAPVAGAMAGNRAAPDSTRATRLQAGARAGRTQTTGRPAR